MIDEKSRKKERILSSEEALDFFDKLANEPCYGWDYQLEGCYARTERVARIGKLMGMKPQKMWLLPEKKDGIFPITFSFKDNGEERKIDSTWAFHVAPAFDVKQPSGKIETLVFDPSCYDGPVTQQQFKESTVSDPNKSFLLSADEAAPGHKNSYWGGEEEPKEGVFTHMRERLKSYQDIKCEWVARKKSAWRHFAEKQGITKNDKQTVSVPAKLPEETELSNKAQLYMKKHALTDGIGA